MSTIPASAIVNVIPNVLNAGGTSLVMNGLQVHRNSTRVPSGTVLSFASAAAISTYFGSTSMALQQATVYFNGFTGCTQLPGALLVTSWPETNNAAWIQSGRISGLTTAQIQALTGTINITIDGYPRTWSVNLSGATSPSAAAGLIQTGLNTTEPSEAVSASGGGAIAATTATFTGTISDDVLSVTSTPTNSLVAGTILTGGSVASGTKILEQLSGAAGGIGTYAVSIAQALPSASLSGSYGVLTLTGSNVSGTFSVGQTLSGGSISAGTAIFQLGTGVGAAGTYYVSPSQTAAATSVTGSATNVVVLYDSVSGAWTITSGITGAPSTVAFATGNGGTALMFTAATGAILSQGVNGVAPGAFMDSVVQINQNWASFFTLLDPDDGLGNANKLAFAAWTNNQNNRYGYFAADTDITPTLSNSAQTSLGYLIGPNGANYSGTVPIYDPSTVSMKAPFAAGYVASLDFGTTNGRTTLAFRSQAGLFADVTTQQVGANLMANGYSFYGAYATANQSFVWLYNGAISGEFLWADSYFNQIYMNNQFQLALMELLQNVGSIPYNVAGGAMMIQALQTEINAALNFGIIRTGIALSSSQALEVNLQAGFPIDGVLTQSGWYAQVQAASPQVRAARTTPPFFFWYTDGGSVQQITLNSIEII